MDEKIFKCFLCNYDRGLLSLYVEGLKIVIVSRIKCGRVINDKKVKSIERILTKFKKVGIFRTYKLTYDGAFYRGRAFDIPHSKILELLDEQTYET
jgi:hypothetical protein